MATLDSLDLYLGKMTEPNEFGKAMQGWWDSDACKEMQKEKELKDDLDALEEFVENKREC